MIQNHYHKNPNSFAETVQLVKSYAIEEVIRETKNKQLYYHSLDHALAVQRRAKKIFQELKFVLFQDKSSEELERWETLIELCALAHDMVQLFHSHSEIHMPRRHISGLSEIETANKLLRYIQSLNQELAAYKLDSSTLFNYLDRQIIKDAIEATICRLDPLAGKVKHSFSASSIYQPYLYDPRPKISVIGSIIALADLGALGMDGVEEYIQDGRSIFLEDNLDLKGLILEGDRFNLPDKIVKVRLLSMAQFMVNFARERYARFELEIAGFTPIARQILRDKIFVYLNSENIARVEQIVPTQDSASLSRLTDFFRLDKKPNTITNC